MKRNTLITALMVCSSQILPGQQEYQANDYGGPGTIYLYNRIEGILPVEEIMQSGPDVTWDISAFGELNTNPLQIVTPGQGIDQATFVTICTLSGLTFVECFNVWSQTDQALLTNDSLSLMGLSLANLIRYQNKTPNLLLENFFGFTIDFGGTPTNAVIVYQRPDTILQFPLMYNDAWTSETEWVIDLAPIGQNIQFSSNQARTAEVDAWGTVMTPYDTFSNVIRLRTEIMHEDTLYTDTLDVPVLYTQVEYMWFDTNYKLPIMIATGILTDTLEFINAIDYIYEATCPAPTWSVDTGSDIFYIDSTGSVTINFEISDPNANIYQWDFGDGHFETSEGNISHTYTTAGNISVGVTGCMTNCLPLNSCSGQIIDFEIIDTVTSVVIIPGNDLGITLYPNPSGEFITIQTPATLGYFDYQILDMTGRNLKSGSLSKETEIFVEDLKPGIYSVRLLSGEGNLQAILRFTVSK